MEGLLGSCMAKWIRQPTDNIENYLKVGSNLVRVWYNDL